MLLFELLDKVNAEIYPSGFEIDKVQATAIVSRVQLPCEIDQFSKRSSNLQFQGALSA